MADVWWLVLVLIPAALAQSGQSDEVDLLDDDEARVSCTSHISARSGNSLTCRLGDHGDDESEEADAVTLCSKSIQDSTWVCVREEWMGSRVTFTHLNVLTTYNLTAQLKGGTYQKAIDLRKIVKPMAPWVINASYLHAADNVEIRIGTPYTDDYLKPNHLLFQLCVWNSSTIVPVSDINYQLYVIEGRLLRRNSQYHVRVRARPTPDYFDGFWSDWSPTITFTTYEDPVSESHDPLLTLLTLLLSVLVMITMTAALIWRKRILSLVWPSIPQPKHTLVQLYHPRKGAPVSFTPEVFSDLCFHLVQQTEAPDPPGPPPPHTDAIASTKDPGLNRDLTEPASDHSTGGPAGDPPQSSGAPDDDPRSRTGASSVGVLLAPGGGPDATHAERRDGEETDPESTGAGEQVRDEAYVTMSSFRQVT